MRGRWICPSPNTLKTFLWQSPPYSWRSNFKIYPVAVCWTCPLFRQETGLLWRERDKFHGSRSWISFYSRRVFWLLVQNLNCVRHEILPIWSVSSLEVGTVFQQYKTVQLVPIINFKNGFPFLYLGIKGINSSLRGMGVGILSISNTYKCTCRRCTHYNTEK